VSVIATFKESSVHGRLRVLVEGESLLNDGTAAVLFTIAVLFADGFTLRAPQIAGMFVLTAVGGVACGLAVGYTLMRLAGRTDDTLVEITFTVIAAYGSFLLAEHLHMSGVLASMSAGLLLGNVGYLRSFSVKGRPAVAAFWEYAAFVANSLVFILIGMHEAKQNLTSVLYSALAAIAFVTLGRAAAIYPSALLFKSSKWRISMHHQHVLFWGGLRGALALALALGVPQNMAGRNDIIAVAFCLVAFSIFVQGLTMAPLLKHFGHIPKELGR
jgi:CPA1 family monovalent cation:H+ antiporter